MDKQLSFLLQLLTPYRHKTGDLQPHDTPLVQAVQFLSYKICYLSNWAIILLRLDASEVL